MFPLFFYLPLGPERYKVSDMANLNRIKVVLTEKKKSSKWLAEELKKDPATISKWCTNVSQPSLETLFDIAHVLCVDVRELLVPTDSSVVMISLSPKEVEN